MLHRFKTGQMLDLRSSPKQSNRPSGPCEVLFCLPHENGPLLYRVRSTSETVERVVDEVDLFPTDAMKSYAFEADRAFKIAVVKR